MFFKRHIKARLIELLNDFRIVYLTGPRQAGKSTLVREIAKELGMGYYTLDDEALAASAASDPQGLLASLPKPLVMDEFQMAPNLIGAIKMVSDTADGQKGILIGKGGATLKEIGTRARKDLEKFLATKVYLELFVKVVPDWSKRAGSRKRFGYE